MAKRTLAYPLSTSRRSLLVSASALLAFAPFAALGAQIMRPVGISDLVDDASQPTDRARDLAGKVIRLRGYPAPVSLQAGAALTLTGGSLAPCQLCGNVHDAGPAILVQPKDGLPASLSMLRIVEVTGVLEIAAEGDVRLLDASVALV